MPNAKNLLNPVAKLSTTPPRNQILLTGTGENLDQPNFALASGDACMNSDPAPRHPHSVAMGFVSNYSIPHDPTRSNFVATFSIGDMATFGDCNATMSPTLGVSMGKLRVTITNYPNPGAGPASASSNNFSVDVDIQDS